jgi:hypothetical protein
MSMQGTRVPFGLTKTIDRTTKFVVGAKYSY